MACLEMYSSSSSSKNSAPMSPRISFSNDFVESNHQHHHHSKPKEAQAVASSDFEFSVTNNSMMSADELIFKGRFLPYKDSQKTITTLRQELLAGDDDEDENGSSEFSLRPPKVSNRWKELLGLKKSHIGSKKAHKPDVASQGSPCLVKELDPNSIQDFAGAFE